jgi:hypothetical protein
MNPTTVNCPSSCTVTLQVEVQTPFFNLDEAGAVQLCAAILAVLALGYAFRVLIQTIRAGGPSEDEKTD